MSDSMPPTIAQELLNYEQGLPPKEWDYFKTAYVKARRSFSPERSLELAIEAHQDEFMGDPSPSCHCCGRTPKPGCRAQGYRAD